MEEKILFNDILKNISNVAESIISKKDIMVNFNGNLYSELKKIKYKITKLKEKIKGLLETINVANTSIDKNEKTIVYKNNHCEELKKQIVSLKNERDNLIDRLKDTEAIKKNQKPEDIYGNL